MRAVLQRVRNARVVVVGEGQQGREVVGEIGPGLLVLVCAMKGDDASDSSFIEHKLLTLRIFPDDAGRMNRSVTDVGGSLLLVSQFTLAAQIGKGARPSFGLAMLPEEARAILDAMVARLSESVSVATGRFGAHMEVELLNDGPVTVWLDSKERGRE